MKEKKEKKPGLLSLLKPYRGMIILLLSLTILGNAVNLWIPKIISETIDTYNSGTFLLNSILLKFSLAVVLIFIFTYLQSVVQTYASEKVGRDLRTKLSDKISKQDNVFVEKIGSSRLLTNLTADVDSIKAYIATAMASIISSIFVIVGVSVLLLTINWKLGLCVMASIPLIAFTYFTVLKKVRAYFKEARGVIDRLNKVINESILGSALIRVINTQQLESSKFLDANTKAKSIGLSILQLFAILIPIIVLIANLAGLCILILGGHFVITGSMTIGDYAAFNSYLAMLIFPILIIGFMSNIIAQATASYDRIRNVMETPDPTDQGQIQTPLRGNIEVEGVNVSYAQKPVLRDINFKIAGGSRTAIIGPTGAGKSQLLYLLTGLTNPGSGLIKFDGHPLRDYQPEHFHSQVGFVFQDSIIFNMSVRENIAFSTTVTDELLAKAIKTAELADFVDAFPGKLDTIVSERGSSLSGGQKQRIMLARALALNPNILLLDDFTARVDTHTEKKILKNIRDNFPGITLISVTQKIEPITDYDQVILVMEGEVIAIGKHDELLNSSPEYAQLYQSQQSTSNYELQS